MTTTGCSTCGNTVTAGARHCATPGCQLHTLETYCGRHESFKAWRRQEYDPTQPVYLPDAPGTIDQDELDAQVSTTHSGRLSGNHTAAAAETITTEVSKYQYVAVDDAPPGYHSWAKEMQGLLQASNDVKWELGASLTYGEDAFGETVWQAIEVTKAQESSLRNYGWVHRKVPPHVRLRDQLSFEHHKAVASLEPEDQARLLALAADGGWPVTALRQEVRELKGKEELPEVACLQCGHRHKCQGAEG